MQYRQLTQESNAYTTVSWLSGIIVLQHGTDKCTGCERLDHGFHYPSTMWAHLVEISVRNGGLIPPFWGGWGRGYSGASFGDSRSKNNSQVNRLPYRMEMSITLGFLRNRLRDHAPDPFGNPLPPSPSLSMSFDHLGRFWFLCTLTSCQNPNSWLSSPVNAYMMLIEPRFSSSYRLWARFPSA